MNKDPRRRWAKFWMRFAGPGKKCVVASFLAWIATPGYKDLIALSWMNRHGFIHPFATVNHPELCLGRHVYIDHNVTVYRAKEGGPVRLEDGVRVMRESILETGDRGHIVVGERSWLHPNAHLFAYLEPIVIGKKVLVAASCSFYPHNHGIAPGMTIYDQPCVSNGPITVEDGAWLGTKVTVLGGVTIGEGAVIGAGSVVTKSIPPNAVAVGTPAKVIKYRGKQE